MPNHPVINQLDPFGENEDEFSTKEIRRSRSRTASRFFINLINPEDEKARKRNRLILLSVILVVILVVVGVIILVNRPKPQSPEQVETLVNPTGREATSSENIPAFTDPEARAYEQEKLNTVLELVKQDDWEYTNALFETIFPNYLDNCGKYDYYRAAIILADNFEGFAISREVATARAEELFSSCSRAVEESRVEVTAQESNSESETTNTEDSAE